MRRQISFNSDSSGWSSSAENGMWLWLCNREDGTAQSERTLSEPIFRTCQKTSDVRLSIESIMTALTDRSYDYPAAGCMTMRRSQMPALRHRRSRAPILLGPRRSWLALSVATRVGRRRTRDWVRPFHTSRVNRSLWLRTFFILLKARVLW